MLDDLAVRSEDVLGAAVLAIPLKEGLELVEALELLEELPDSPLTPDGEFVLCVLAELLKLYVVLLIMIVCTQLITSLQRLLSSKVPVFSILSYWTPLKFILVYRIS
jgi:hypothetical protein